MSKKDELKGIRAEFKKFILRGNVVDLAVGVIIGAAFQSIVKSLVDDIIMPVISLLTGGYDFTSWVLVLGEGDNAATLNYGSFISAVLNFLIMAVVIFALVKVLNRVTSIGKKKKDEPAALPTTKACPFCKSEIAIDATRCPHCTSELN